MKCEYCNRDMSVVGLEVNGDNTECRQEHACVNPNCVAYSGRNLNNPLRSMKGEWTAI